ncbi:4'-phosphopantetheinyl transferase superfamily protein [Emticicia sp. W12TSBA100-4]|uniref:4'-phosphopantetheinyl transferase family protein n=1 Tax=Emticicia sp. W12TSBA100-4 TaxID=3160965 RepID=UPI003305E0E7
MSVILEKKYENNISLAVWQITESHDELQAMLPSEILTDAELASISHPQKQVEFFCSRLVIKHLANSLGIKYLGIKKDEHGKPYLAGSNWQMSITHTSNYVAAVMHPSEALGMDMEKPSEKLQRIAHKFLSESERIQAEGDIEKLCIYWSAKEALYKLYGKRKVIFNENLFVFPFLKKQNKITGRLKINEIDKEYCIYVEKIDGYILVVAGLESVPQV